MLKRIKNNYFLLISTFLILYFFFNLLSGQRGLISYFEKKQTLNNLKNKELLLGTWQGIYLFEHRLNPQTRTIIHHFIGEG